MDLSPVILAMAEAEGPSSVLSQVVAPLLEHDEIVLTRVWFMDDRDCTVCQGRRETRRPARRCTCARTARDWGARRPVPGWTAPVIWCASAVNGQPGLGRTVPKVPQREMDKLVAYDWPGNVRELPTWSSGH